MGREDKYALKINRWDGSESVLGWYDSEETALEFARLGNESTQSEQYSVEPFDPNKLRNWPRHGRRNRLGNR